MTSVSKKFYINKLDDIVNKYNNTYHNTIKMRPVDIKSNTYIEINKEIHDQNRKFKIVDNVRISKYKNFFAKVYTPSWSEEFLVIIKVINTVSLMISMEKNLLEYFTKMNSKKQIRKNLELEK